MKTSSAHVLQGKEKPMLAVLAKAGTPEKGVSKKVDTPRKGVSREEVAALVNTLDGTRVNIDIEAGTIEIVAITGFNSVTSTAESCKHVRECKAHEENLLLWALASNMIGRHPCESRCGTMRITVYIAFMC